MTENFNWSHFISENLDKFHLESIDQDGQIFWCRRVFKNQLKAERFATLTEQIIHSYAWLIDYSEAEYAFFQKFFLLVDAELLYRHWVIEIKDICNDLYVTLHDPLGTQIEMPSLSLDEITQEQAIAQARAEIDRIENDRYVIPGQLSLFN